MAAFGFGVYVRWFVDRRLADAIAAADRDDPHWRLNDLMARREPVPDAENSAVVVGEVLAILPGEWPASPPPPPGGRIPPMSEASRAFEELRELGDSIRLDDATAEPLRRELERYREAVRIARSVRFYARGSHVVTLGPTLIDTLLTETQASRAAGRLLEADTAIRAHDGDPDGALDSCRANLNTGRSIGDEPFAISQLVRMAIVRVATKSARRVLGQGEPSDAALARLQALILDERDQPLLLQGMKAERATLTELIRRLATGEVPVSALNDARVPFDPGGLRGTVTPWGRVMFDHQRAVALEWMNRAVAIARRPLPEQPERWKAWEENIDRVRASKEGVYTALFAYSLMPKLTSFSSAFAHYQGDLGATAILLAAERHRRKTSAWPVSLAAIDRDILPDAPVDPCSGRDYRMEHHDGQIVIYSIGPNGEDEQGEYDPKQWDKGWADDVGAIGWDVNLRRRPAPPHDEEYSTRHDRGSDGRE
jgi:hypothetical protein